MRLRWPRQRRGEAFVALAGVVTAALSLLAVGGFLPGVLPSSPISFSQQIPVCSPTITTNQRSQSLTLPAWAAVRLEWRVAPAYLYVTYEVNTASGTPVYFTVGSSGNGSFSSIGGTYRFTPVFVEYAIPLKNTNCTTADVLTTVTYTP
jgi:hypothetical protein